MASASVMSRPRSADLGWSDNRQAPVSLDSFRSTDFYRRLRDYYCNQSTTKSQRARCLQLLNSFIGDDQSTKSNQSPPGGVASTQPEHYKNQQQQASGSQPCPPAKRRLQRRPHTVMGSIDVDERRVIQYNRSPYETSYSRDYKQPQFTEAQAVRPTTVVGKVLHAGQVRGGTDDGTATTYREDYNSHAAGNSVGTTGNSNNSNNNNNNGLVVDRTLLQTACKATPIYPLNGEKRNNPHPLRPFMIWRHPNSRLSGQDLQKPEVSTSSADNRKLKGNLSSTYQSDYLETLLLRQKLKDNPTRSGHLQQQLTDNDPSDLFSLDSTMRYDFQRPATTIVDLRVPTSRYASNVNKQRPATGAVPDVLKSSFHMAVPEATSYVHDFCERWTSDDGKTSSRDVLRHCDAQQQQQQQQSASVETTTPAKAGKSSTTSKCEPPKTNGRQQICRGSSGKDVRPESVNEAHQRQRAPVVRFRADAIEGRGGGGQSGQ